MTGWRDGPVPCADPECTDQHGRRGIAEPEQDGDTHYYECTECGNTFGYERIVTAVSSNDTCAVGIPEDIRRRASAAMESAMATSGPVLLQIGRRPDAADA